MVTMTTFVLLLFIQDLEHDLLLGYTKTFCCFFKTRIFTLMVFYPWCLNKLIVLTNSMLLDF
jgi:hypothetical protein